MTPFAALDEVLQNRALTPASSRDLTPPAATDFQPLFAPGALSSAKEPAATHGHEPQIELIQADGRVQQIIVTCGCGERTVLDCSY